MVEIVEIQNACKFFPIKMSLREIFGLTKQHYLKAVDDVSFKIGLGKVFVLAGESGSGKTTIARLILRAIDVDSGSILFEGEDITRYRGSELRKFRINVQMVHQDPYASLNPRMKIMDIVMEPLSIHDKQSSKEERKQKALRALEDVRLQPAAVIAQKFPYMLSGGQRQRVALARALVLKPKLIVADEPVSMLDVSVRAEMLELMNSLRDKFRISYLYITHDLSTSRYIGDTIAIMYAGKIVELGPINQVLSNPLHPYTQALIDSISEPDANNLKMMKRINIKQGQVRADIGCRFYHRCPYSMEICKNDPRLIEEEVQHYVSCFLYPR
ncbi:MAG TPA: ABC transporter ATP-binding protein [Candidatus Nitrosopolaris sp.]